MYVIPLRIIKVLYRGQDVQVIDEPSLIVPFLKMIIKPCGAVRPPESVAHRHSCRQCHICVFYLVGRLALGKMECLPVLVGLQISFPGPSQNIRAAVRFYFAIGQELPEQAPVEQGDGAGAAGAGLPLP